MYELTIQNTVKTCYMMFNETGLLNVNITMLERIKETECEYMDIKQNEKIDNLKVFLEEFKLKQYYPLKIEYSDYKRKVNIGLIHYLSDLSDDVILLENSSTKYSILKSILETTIMICWLNKKSDKEKDIFEKYIAYGESKTTNSGIKFGDELESVLLRTIILPNTAPLNIVIDHDYFEGNIKEKFRFVGSIELYEKYYEICNMYTHAMWPAVYLNSMDMCTKPLHEHHFISSDPTDIFDVYDISLLCWKLISSYNIEYICKIEME